MAYNLNAPPSPEELQHLAQPWRPYRTRVSLHLRAMLEAETRETAQQAKP